MSLFFQDPTALIFKVTGSHRLLANKQNARFVIELDTELRVPFAPECDATVSERGVKPMAAMEIPNPTTDASVTGRIPYRSMSLPRMMLPRAMVKPEIASPSVTCERVQPRSLLTGLMNVPMVFVATGAALTTSPKKLPTTTHQRF